MIKRRDLFGSFSTPSNGHFLHRKWQTVLDLPLWIHRLFAVTVRTIALRASFAWSAPLV